MSFVRVALSIVALLGPSAAFAAAAPPAPPPFNPSFPETKTWAFTCFCGKEECPDLDPITDYCVVYNAKSTRAKSRMIFFALKTMVTGREPKFVIGFGIEGAKGATRGQTVIGDLAVNLPACAEPFCYASVTADDVAALGASPKVEGRVYFGASSFGTSFDGARANALLQKLITLPQHN